MRHGDPRLSANKIKAKIQFIFLVLCMLMLSSCASYKLKIKEDYQDWHNQKTPDKPLDYRVYLIGNTGDSGRNGLPPTLKILGEQLKNESENSAVIFLGDIAASNGLPDKYHPDRERAERDLKAKLDFVKDYPGQLFFLPGDLEWKGDGLGGLRRQEDFIEAYLNRGNVFLPDEGCSGPEEIELTDEFAIVAFDSQWFLADWDEVSELNEACDIRNKEVFFMELRDALRDFRGKNVLLIAHHPIISQGRYGGKYSWKEHLFPLSNCNPPKYIPMPVLGTLATWFKSATATRQDLSHPVYKEYIDAVEEVMDYHGRAILAASHEQNLQLETDGEVVQIISGGGSEKDPVSLGLHTPFAYGGLGYSVLNVYEDGEVWVEFFGTQLSSNDTLERRALKPVLLYRQKLRDPLPSLEELTPDEFPEYEKGLDSVSVSVLERGEIWDMGHFLWGKLWTEEYYKDIKVPVLDMVTYDGGVKAFKRGGGFQTKSLRLRSEVNDRVWQMRSLKKSAERLFYPLNKTFVREILKYQFTAGNPYGAFIIPELAESAGILHTNPKLYYVPKQPNLNKFSSVGGELYLVEERPDEKYWNDNADFGYPDEIVSTFKALEERMESDKAVIDQPKYLRARLFDNLTGDWDRHQDQWRWAEIEMEDSDKKLYQPIPRDRDQVFANYGGMILHIGRLLAPFFKASNPFDDSISKWESKWLNYQARDLDRAFLNELTWEDWEKEIAHLRENLTDEVIENAVGILPDTLYESMAPKIIQGLKSRRDNLTQSSRWFYDFLNKKVKIVGTHQENLFLIDRMNNDQTKVTAYEISKKGERQKIYERIIDNKITKEIELYGLEGDDRFEVKGKSKNSPILRLIGGLGEDVFKDNSSVSGWTRKTKVYDDWHEHNKVEGNSETEDQRSNRKELNSYGFWHETKFNRVMPLPIFGFNPDDGLYFGASAKFFQYGFKRETFHTLSAKFASSTSAFGLYYTGDFHDVWEKKDFYLDIVAESPQYTNNFFGLGNETVRKFEDWRNEYYRVRREKYSIFPALKERTEAGTFFVFGPFAELIKIKDTEGRFLTSDATNVRQEVFEYQYFGGFKMIFNYDNVDNDWNPERGFRFKSHLHWKTNLKDFDRNYAQIKSSMTLYLPIGIHDRWLFATRIGGSHNIGTFDFFQASFLGGDVNLRGFGSERFAGRTAFYHNNEMRVCLLHKDSEKNHLPMTFGIAPAFDYGRVWINDEHSKKWHYSYGGSVWLAPFDYLAVTFGMMKSSEQKRFTITIGFDF